MALSRNPSSAQELLTHRADKRALFTAACKAKAAADWLHARVRVLSRTGERGASSCRRPALPPGGLRFTADAAVTLFEEIAQHLEKRTPSPPAACCSALSARWGFQFGLQDASRKDRRRVSKSGFATKREAEDAEARSRVEEHQKIELAKAGSGVAAKPPTTLAFLLSEFFAQHVDDHLAPKTVERYHEQAALLHPGLLAMKLSEITPLHLNREWKRLLASGGHHRRTKEPRPLSKKTVRNVAGVLSSAFSRAMKWGLLSVNPVTNSEPPIPPKRKGSALTTAQQDLLIESATGPWCIGTYLNLDAALGARRGEVLALRWSDIKDGRVTIGRSLSQTRKDGLIFKSTKEENVLTIGVPPSALADLEVHRQRQNEFRVQFGSDYRSDLDLIFANPDGTPLKPDSVSATVSALFKRLKIPKAKGSGLHLLRHSHGSHMLANGVPLPVVSQRLGHSSVRITADIYAHAIHGQDDEAVKKWEEYQEQHREKKPNDWKGDVQ